MGQGKGFLGGSLFLGSSGLQGTCQRKRGRLLCRWQEAQVQQRRTSFILSSSLCAYFHIFRATTAPTTMKTTPTTDSSNLIGPRTMARTTARGEVQGDLPRSVSYPPSRVPMSFSLGWILILLRPMSVDSHVLDSFLPETEVTSYPASGVPRFQRLQRGNRDNYPRKIIRHLHLCICSCTCINVLRRWIL
ncbi:hypothetical protein BDN70DRAFT_160993 [Pholiota conissans]|uniref:Uncharacterized protein n=1 Tax=Pholiota conissans TaxID=109636 RepID=A0A9P5YWT3_9AGAR|nr:hypothetical protein BDN70DRAFT_160993 [Pholiota conissans]